MWADSASEEDVDGSGTRCYIIISWETEADWWLAEAGYILSFRRQNRPNLEFFVSSSSPPETIPK